MVRDAQTGAVHSTIRATDLGVALQPGDRAWADGIPGSDLMLDGVDNGDTTGPVLERIVDATSGQIVHRIPQGFDASMLDSRSLILSDAE